MAPTPFFIQPGSYPISDILRRKERFGDTACFLPSFTPVSIEAEEHYALAQLTKKRGAAATSKHELERTQHIREAKAKRDLTLGAVLSGVVLAQKGDYDGAIVEFRKALTLNPQLGEVHFNLVGALLQKGEIRAAIQTFPAALKQRPIGRKLIISSARLFCSLIAELKPLRNSAPP